MPTSLSDFCTKIAAQVTPSGAIFRTTVNPDGSIQILRSASGVSGASGGPTSPWTVYLGRVIYNVVSDTVLIGDGSNMTASTAAAFIAGLN